jgi:branched-chain amino acid transport system permease protein
MISVIPQILINGILFGTMYGIAAVGLSLIFGTMRLIFLAQGTMIVLFAYMCYWFFTLLGIDPYLTLALIIPIAVAIGMGFYYGIFKEAAALEDKNVSLLLAVGIMYLVENLMLVLWEANPRSVVTGYTGLVFHPFGLTISFTRLMALVLAVISAGAVFIFLKRTIIGTAVRAASEDMTSTTLMGINPNWVNAVAFTLGIGLAGVAGVALASVYSFDPNYGFVFAIKALIALTLGGIGNVYGALLGGLLLGIIESSASFYIGSGWTEAISYGVFLAVLTFRPYGLFGGSAKKT